MPCAAILLDLPTDCRGAVAVSELREVSQAMETCPARETCRFAAIARLAPRRSRRNLTIASEADARTASSCRRPADVRPAFTAYSASDTGDSLHAREIVAFTLSIVPGCFDAGVQCHEETVANTE
jgi:hypothetical protein